MGTDDRDDRAPRLLESPTLTNELLALFETLVNVMFCVKDADGFYVEVNTAFVRRTGRASKREVIGQRAHDLFAEERAALYEEQDRLVIAGEGALRDELELIRRPNGGLGWYLTSKRAVASGAGGALVGLRESRPRNANRPWRRGREPATLRRTRAPEPSRTASYKRPGRSCRVLGRPTRPPRTQSVRHYTEAIRPSSQGRTSNGTPRIEHPQHRRHRRRIRLL